MKDFPVFTTEYGVASLILKEIPYQGVAYVIVRDSLEPELLIKECVSFCRMCGAEAVYATGHDYLRSFPLYTALLEMCCMKDELPETDAALWPVQEETLEHWRSIYNEKIVRVPNGAWMTQADGAEMLKRGDGYFIHRGKEILGIGIVSADRMDWVASVQPGAGRDVVCALAHAATEETISLTVASVNEKAVKLYEGLGFIRTKEIRRWHTVFEKK